MAALVESSSYAVVTKSIDGVIRTWNAGATALYGSDESAMIGRSIDDLIPEAERALERDLREQVAHGESVRAHHCTRLRADGEPIDILMSMFPVRDTTGAIAAIGSLSRQVNASETADARFASLLEAAPDAIIAVDEAGLIAVANAYAAEMFGYPRGELAGTPLRELLPDDVKDIHETHVASFMRHPQARAMGTGMALTARRRDGTVFPVEIGLAPDAARSTGYVIAAVRDVTERVGIESAARENAERLRQLAESVDIMFVLLDLDDLAVLYISPASRSIFGREPEEFLDSNDPVGMVVHPEDRDRVAGSFLPAIASRQPAISEYRVIHTHGRERWVRAVNRLVDAGDARARRSVITIEDITDRVAADSALQAAETAARNANEAKNLFLSRMSHELRTPLNAILGFGQLLQYELAETSQIEAVNQIVKGGRHLLNLINDVLDVARIEAGEMSISTEPVPLTGLIDESIKLMAPLAEATGVVLRGGAAHEDVSVLADRQRLRQILLNLLSNAIKYNRRGGRVWVDIDAAADSVAITVWDDGPGIPTDLRSRLFTPFDRLGADPDAVDGTGIGLALTRSLAELMMGTVTVADAAESGIGFTITLPRAAHSHLNHGAPDPIDRTGVLSETTAGARTLLYVEDNEPNVRVIESILRLRPQWTMIHAGLGTLGIDLALTHRPDLILLDLHLPDRAGADVLHTLKSDPLTRAIPVVVVTADASTTLPRRMADLGANHLLTKPFELEELLSVLDEHSNAHT